jgi:hypothetical protein
MRFSAAETEGGLESCVRFSQRVLHSTPPSVIAPLTRRAATSPAPLRRRGGVWASCLQALNTQPSQFRQVREGLARSLPTTQSNTCAAIKKRY